jgi:hypothetical protein
MSSARHRRRPAWPWPAATASRPWAEEWRFHLGAGAGLPDPRRIRALAHAAIPRGALVTSESDGGEDAAYLPGRAHRRLWRPAVPARRIPARLRRVLPRAVRPQGARDRRSNPVCAALSDEPRQRPRDDQAPGRTVLGIPTGGGRYFKYRPPLVPISRWIGFVWS